MKVLITGGYGFIGSTIAEKFFREEHDIFIIDNLSTGKRGNIYFRHKSLLSNIEDEACEVFFKEHKFDIVIHCAAQTSVQVSIDSPLKDSEVNIAGLNNMLHLSSKYDVKKFVFTSSAAVYGNNPSIPLTEETIFSPISPYGINKQFGEMYCEKWNELYNLSTLIFRFSNVYGPKQAFSVESGVISIFLNKVLHNGSLMIQGDGEQTRDFIYVGDVADAVYRSVISELTGIYNLSTSTQTSINELVGLLSNYREIGELTYSKKRSGDIEHSLLSNRKIIADLDWVPKYKLNEGLEKTIAYYEAEIKEVESSKSVIIKKYESIVKEKSPSIPYVENIVLFGIFLLLFNIISPLLNTVDLWLIYILLTGLLFGKTQAVVASVLSISVQIIDKLGNGRSFTSLFIDDAMIATFMIYLVIGFVVGYVVDKRKIELQFAEDELNSFHQKYTFLNNIYQDNRQVKESLQDQILNSEDSVGKVYNAVKKLDNLEPEEVFHGAMAVLEDLLRAEKFSIYLVNPDGGYLRLMSKSNIAGFDLSSSIQAENTLYGQAIETGKMQFNWELIEDAPIFVSPITDNNQVIAVIAGYDLPFEKLTLYYQNLIEVTTRLISTSLSRAYNYLMEIRSERYLKDTKILTPVYLQRILDSKLKSFTDLNVPYAVLKFEGNIYDQERMNNISKLLRINDYLGINVSNEIYLVLSNASLLDAENVLKRLTDKGYNAIVLEGDIMNVC